MGKSCIDDILEQMREYLSRRNDIAFAFLFGSVAAGHRNVLSDLDLAIFFDGPLDFFKITDMREEISGIFGLETDIVALNSASPIIRMQVLKKGVLLVKRDPRAYNNFFVNTVKEYDDLKRSRREIENNILRGRIYA